MCALRTQLTLLTTHTCLFPFSLELSSTDLRPNRRPYCFAPGGRREVVTRSEAYRAHHLRISSAEMMKASVKGRYDTDKSGAAAASLAFNAGDVKLKASMTEATVVNGPSLNGLALSVEKPGNFIVDYDVPRKDFRFQFMNTVTVLDKPLRLNYMHWRGQNRTILDGTLVLDSANKVSANYVFGSGNCKLKYTYQHGRVRTFEPSYDLSSNSWDFAVSQRVSGDDVFRASYQTSSKVLGLEWCRDSKMNGTFKILASLNLAEEVKIPKLSAESTWNFEM